MSSPTPSTIEDVIIPSGDPQDYPISCIFGQLIEPKHGRVSPDFLEYQDPGAANTASDQEGESVKANGTGVEVGCYDLGSDFSARLLTGYDYGTPQVSFHISHGQSSQSAE